MEEEIGRLKIAATEERLRAEEHVMHMKQKVKADEVNLYKIFKVMLIIL